MLGHRRRGLADTFSEVIDAEFAVDQCPQQLDAGGVGQHPEDFDDQMGMVRSQLPICIHTQIVANAAGTNPPAGEFRLG
ncbi:hypothetical protein MSZK_27500 [Mycobacterium sp. shizuoka-1]|nr:hypothetical protein MSZK_27500 [Mycobacterium sp. shizuoka-1]